MIPARPPLPDGFGLPAEVNGWYHDPETGKNAHAWYSADGETAVGVFDSLGRVYACVSDERCDGFERSVEIEEVDIPDGDEHTEREGELVAEVVERAVEWMEATEPSDWSHPDVEEAVFDAPPGYVLERYYLEQRDVTIYYRREDVETPNPLAGARHPEDIDDDVEPADYPCLVVHCWRGSGNATISVAPWVRAHDHAMREILEPPAECGLGVAISMARQWASENVAEEEDVDEAPQAGQSALADF